MVAKKARVVIIGAGMAGLTAANKLYTEQGSTDLFDLYIVEAGDRIGGRIRTSSFGGDRIELGATYIHGIGGSPVHKIARETGGLHSDEPWERMDGFPEDPITVAEGGFKLDSSLVDPISLLYRKLMDFAQGKPIEEEDEEEEEEEEEEEREDGNCRIAARAVAVSCKNGFRGQSIGDFLRRGLEAYWVLRGGGKLVPDCGSWSRGSLEEAIFVLHENTERTYTSASDLSLLDFDAEKEYRGFPGEEITIAKGYSSIIQSIASVLPFGVIQLGRKVTKIEWHPDGFHPSEDNPSTGPVKLHFTDGSTMAADHVIVTVSLGVLKAGTRDGCSLFSPLLPSFKTEAISRLGFGVVNKLFLQLEREEDGDFKSFPFLEMAFQQNSSVTKQGKVPWWMRRTASLCPIYKNSRVLLGWFAGKEALELESLKDSEIIEGVSSTLSTFHMNSSQKSHQGLNSHCCNGNVNGVFQDHQQQHAKFAKVLRSGWGTDPLFLGSYSFVAVGSSGEDLDSMAEPLPKGPPDDSGSPPQLQLLFAGEATHRTHYSTTHGAYFSGIREAKRLLQHYRCGLP